MNPDAEYSAQRTCRFCKTQTRVRVCVKEWVVVITCTECQGVFELPRY